jgi:16S rRNA (guanine527-N7)-methyltransferase
MNEAQQIEPVENIAPTIEERIMRGLDALDVSYGERAISKLVSFMELLREWNQTHNLTAVDDMDEMVCVHILDSVSIKPYMKGASLLDVGSGAGLPGMVLAILSPALEVTSVESRGKKTQFQMFAANKLGLENFTVVNKRIEEFEPKEKFAMVVSRAYADLETFVCGSKQAIAPNGRWLAMKGLILSEELKPIKKMGLKYDTYALKVPELEAQRNLVVIRPAK